MKNKILIELRTAIDVSGNNFLQLCHGEKRIQQYVDGLSQFYKNIEHFKNCDIVFVDNTLESEDNIPTSIRKCLSDDTFLYVKNKNNYGKFNKGAGDIEMWKEYSEILEGYEYFFHYEPRLILKDFSFIQSFLKNPRNYFTLGKVLRDDQVKVKTGYFGVFVKDFFEFYSQIDLNYMVNNFISLEDIMFDFFKHKDAEFDSNTYCIWHDSHGNKYYEY